MVPLSLGLEVAPFALVGPHISAISFIPVKYTYQYTEFVLNIDNIPLKERQYDLNILVFMLGLVSKVFVSINFSRLYRNSCQTWFHHHSDYYSEVLPYP
jgi:hypothetical protein